MKMSGHKTRSVFDRYDIISEADIRDAASKIEAGAKAVIHSSFIVEAEEEENRKEGNEACIMSELQRCGSGGTGRRARLRIPRFPSFKPTHLCSTFHRAYHGVERLSFKLALSCSLLLIVWLQISQSVFAQEKPDAPKPKHDRKAFIAGTALPAASKTADAITTRRVLDIPGGRGCELNPLFGPHPSPAAQAGINLGIFVAQSAAFYFTERSRHKWIRWTGRAFLSHEIEEHTRLAACNAGLNTHFARDSELRAGHAILKKRDAPLLAQRHALGNDLSRDRTQQGNRAEGAL